MSSTSAKASRKESSSSQSVKSFESKESTSVALERQIMDILKSHSKAGTLKDTPIRMVDVANLDSLKAALVKCMEDTRPHTVNPAELAKLNAELAALRLRVCTFESDKDRAEQAAAVASGELQSLKAKFDHQAKVETARREILRKEADTLKQQLLEAKALNEDAKAAVRATKKTATSEEGLKEVELNALSAAAEVTRLNNELQGINSERAKIAQRNAAFEEKILELTNELNIMRARGNLESEFSFAKMARGAKTQTIDLTSKAMSSLSLTSKEFIRKALKADPGDVKYRAKYLNIALKESRSKLAKTYRYFFDGLYDDIKISTHQSQLAFQPIVEALLDSLTGKRAVLTEAELELLTESLDPTQIRMVKSVRDKGFPTLQDVIDAGLTAESIALSDIENSQEQPAEDLLKASRAQQDKAKEATKIKFVKKQVDQLKEKPRTGSVYQKVKSWFHNAGQWVKQRTNTTVGALEKKWSLRTRDNLRRKGWWGRIAATPFSLLFYFSFGTL